MIITTSVNRYLSLYYVLVLFFVLYIMIWAVVSLVMELVVGLAVKVCGGVECVDIEVLRFISYIGSWY